MVSRYIEEAISAFIEHQDLYRNRMRQFNALNPLNVMRQAFESSFGREDSGAKSSTTKPASKEDNSS